MVTPKKPLLTPELAQRLQRALSAESDELFALVQEPHPEVLTTLLKNPAFEEPHLLALLKRRDLNEELLRAIYQSEAGKSHNVRRALARHPLTPGPVVLAILPHLYLFELLDITLLPGMTPDQRFAAERQIIQRLPTTELGNRMALARRAGSTIVGELFKTGERQVFEICLTSPHLKEVAILQYLNGPRADAETISLIARHPRWKNRPNLRLAILKNHRTPSIWFTLFLPRLNVGEVRNLLISRRLTPPQHQLVKDELRRRGLAR
ncbi:MAG: hypothetical protein C0621_10625 [Desulfuromonas sp.]|nr:MAG: hypothetical protein C0621_10625 [Desulfuromonas sp.]